MNWSKRLDRQAKSGQKFLKCFKELGLNIWLKIGSTLFITSKLKSANMNKIKQLKSKMLYLNWRDV